MKINNHTPVICICQAAIFKYANSYTVKVLVHGFSSRNGFISIHNRRQN